MPPLRSVLLLAFLLGGCPVNGAGLGAEHRPTAAEPAWLDYDGRRLLLDQGGARSTLEAPVPALAYAVQADAPLLLATALLPGLRVLSVAAAAGTAQPQLHCFLDELPVALQPAVVLSPLPDTLSGAVAGCRVLLPDGSTRWRSEPGRTCEYLPVQADGAPAGQRLCFVDSSPGDPTLPYSMDARLLWLATTDARDEPQQQPLGLAGAAAGVELLAQTAERALLLVLYNYEALELLLLDLGADSRTVARWQLSGQPQSQIIYPGPSQRWTLLAQQDSLLSMAVIDRDSESTQLWQIDLDRGERQVSALEQPASSARDATNAFDIGASVPFAQDALPSSRLDRWRCAALVDTAGNVLVVSGAGEARWIKP